MMPLVRSDVDIQTDVEAEIQLHNRLAIAAWEPADEVC